jgi:hypothetical protein
MKTKVQYLQLKTTGLFYAHKQHTIPFLLLMFIGLLAQSCYIERQMRNNIFTHVIALHFKIVCFLVQLMLLSHSQLLYSAEFEADCV